MSGSRASRRAVASPIPADAPVISATNAIAAQAYLALAGLARSALPAEADAREGDVDRELIGPGIGAGTSATAIASAGPGRSITTARTAHVDPSRGG